MIQFDEQQRESIQATLKGMGLDCYLTQVEKMMMGEITPFEVLQIIGCFYRVGWLKGLTAALETQNECLREAINKVKVKEVER